MADDPYTLLGIARTATEKQIRTAFLQLAKTSHPDVNPGDKRAEERFKAISSAHDLLSDPVKRARFDRGELDATGQEAPPRGYRPSGAQPGSAYAGGDMEDILAGMFSGQGRGGPVRPRRGSDQRYTLVVSFLDAANGAKQRLALPTGGNLDVQVPPGIESGQTLRLRGKGIPEHGKLPAGDAYATLRVMVGPADDSLRDFLRDWAPGQAFDPRNAPAGD